MPLFQKFKGEHRTNQTLYLTRTKRNARLLKIQNIQNQLLLKLWYNDISNCKTSPTSRPSTGRLSSGGKSAQLERDVTKLKKSLKYCHTKALKKTRRLVENGKCSLKSHLELHRIFESKRCGLPMQRLKVV